MKKIFKTLAILGVAGVAAAGVASFTACNTGKTYNGEYHYNSNDTEYGIKVAVTVDGDKITKVEVVESDYVSVTESYKIPGVWDDDSIANWKNNLNNLLKSYEGKTVEEVLAIDVAVTDYVPDSEQTFEGLVITGATQGSGRLLLAVQDAIKDLAE